MWKAVEQKDDGSFFTSWYWVASWLQIDSSSQKFLLVATIDAQPVGVALWSHKLKRAQHHYLLHKSGNKAIDQVWIEHNDFVVQREHADLIKSKMWEAWFNFTPRNSKYFVGASKPDAFTQPRRLACFDYLEWTANSYSIPLAPLVNGHFDNIDQHLMSYMSANTRTQLKRSLHFYNQEYGALTLHFATSTKEALGMFNRASTWHEDRWGQSGESGFSNQAFIAFHHHMIAHAFPENAVEVVEVRAGNHSLGVFYNFIWKDKAYFYLSSLNYQKSNLARPGMVGHFMLGRHYSLAGCKSYDLLGGGDYKARFSVQGPELQISVFYNAGLLNALEISLRKLKSRFVKA
ncbi:MAG: hypothetical protein NVSMB6_03250 [Burkholderiaceae bacterium]